LLPSNAIMFSRLLQVLAAMPADMAARTVGLSLRLCDEKSGPRIGTYKIDGGRAKLSLGCPVVRLPAAPTSSATTLTVNRNVPVVRGSKVRSVSDEGHARRAARVKAEAASKLKPVGRNTEPAGITS